jgi:hypothetical protein
MKNRQIPAGAREQKHPAANLVAYLYESQRRPCLMIYKGRQARPIQCIAFTGAEGEASRDRHLASVVKSHTDDMRWSHARRNARHELKVGDVLYRTWGYEQTNVDFYQVVRVPSDRSVVLRKLLADVVRNDALMSGKATPRQDQFHGAQETIHRATGAKTVTGGKEYGGDLTWWDGKPQAVTSYA